MTEQTPEPRKPARGLGIFEAIAALGIIAVLSTVVALPKTTEEIVSANGPGGVQNPNDPARPGGPVQGGDPRGHGPGKPGGPLAPSSFECAPGRNGGATDVGVTANSIKLGATVVDTGIGATFLADVRYGMLAVSNAVNAAGGVCGRRLNLVLKDDRWEAGLGKLFIENLVESEKVFALAVVPSSEGLRAADSYIRAKGVPVVGTDGMLISQYSNPMIWPVAASTISSMHIMAKDAHDRGARNFAIVYDSNYRFGVEGAFAFNAAVRRLTGSDVPGYSNPLRSPGCAARFCGVKAGAASYQTELEVVRGACQKAPRCDYVAYLLEPETAQTWMRGGGIRAGYLGDTRVAIGGPQPLFNRPFGVNCADKCHDMWVWTGFVPSVPPFNADPSVAAYVADVRRSNSRADVDNSFVVGGYIGMKLLVQALQKVGGNVTRARLSAALDSLTLTTGLAKPLSFTPDNHFANRCMMAFSIQARPSFGGWRQETDWVCDPWLGQDVPEES